MHTPANRVLHPVSVIGIERCAPLMTRFIVAGQALHDMPVSLPGQWLKVFFPAEPGTKAHGRAYTIRSFDPKGGTIALDFVLHGDGGKASKWAGEARLNDILQVAGPREGYEIDPAIRTHLLVGDSTSLPAISAILESLPAQAVPIVLLELTDEHEKKLLASHPNQRARILLSESRLSGTTGALEAAIKYIDLPSDLQVWLAGEATMVRSIRLHLTMDRGFDRSVIQASGYWRVGIQDHRDPDFPA
ncbi:siderophore-interacting protein [Mesorhizobium sp. M7A.F.Ca.US.001.04.1.1]|uniref:siderophore-interacting protein n=1 Tax=unclassified Mesorhizobium TaxID=325217 RepID=UPI000FCA5561|nr:MULTISPECIES: siderophore-interacting protein [unclassified Mesorhizobium]RUY27343.1 siderophore-interacting protein [Mesorhizobium sp. M7A.F.Ca.US.001.04.2.1]RUY39389.1 siderophore-interacting protein [Mesorhizobium sp. M7A.F.Ca.US.001.04.1.1]